MSGADDLIGTWVSDPEDREGTQEFGRVTLVFEKDGELTYTVHAAGKDQKMFLTFRVEGEVIVTDQPSSPRQERTRFSVGSDGKLTVWFGGQRAVYVHEE